MERRKGIFSRYVETALENVGRWKLTEQNRRVVSAPVWLKCKEGDGMV